MVKIVICIGSSCHLKGSRQVVESLQKLIADNDFSDKVELSGSFCMNKCSADGVSITVDGEYYEVKPEAVEDFFNNVVVAKLN